MGLTERDWSASTSPMTCRPGSRFKKRPLASDHWHRTEDDPGRPYIFKDVGTLLDDFFDEAERVLAEQGIGMTVIEVEDTRRST